MSENEGVGSSELCEDDNRSMSSAMDADLAWIPGEDEHIDGEIGNGDVHGDSDDEKDEGREADMPRYMASALSSVLATDLARHHNYHEEEEGLMNVSMKAVYQGCDEGARKKVCCICGDAALYTCPGCSARTCSITCVRMHKQEFNCTGERDIAKKVPLGEFTDKHLERDYHFLEDVRRVVNNCDRTFPKMWRYTFRALPPPLHALREAAKKRGVVCQITSEGMAKRDANTSRYDRKTETITWRCQFNFHKPDFSVATDWGSERHRLGDILAYCWATNPPLPCFHINKQYNRASKWIGTGKYNDAEQEDKKEKSEEKQEQEEEKEVSVEESKKETVVDSGDTPEPQSLECNNNLRSQSQDQLQEHDQQEQQQTEEMWIPSKIDVSPVLSEMNNKRDVESFMAMEPIIILAQAERLGLQRKYFRLSPFSTLNETLRTLFFINEYPVFEVIHASDLELYPLVTETDKENIRESFRMTPRLPKPERKPRRTKADLTPDEIERYSKVPCRMFLAGRCKLTEDDCPYWHCEYKDVPACRSFVKFASCEKGDRCSFRHDPAAVGAARKRAREERHQACVQRNKRRIEF
ncbi:zinc finger protein [Trypanosoma melophagium]|uniref:zinc finger protein n=1 Tax=Trypanosoma melophagium TaxID=715481 RepID=UPI00351A25A5|nr:zinc finger protein [Trypanosoma melophagium]